ncbi:hypothetical protein RR48_07010 [Papilio machaon]|uniref:Uncharacterized protein n=1 Tax=Papilio machaon TaxID=76193 RepID=A0A194RAF7_PAPMA|nr:hypothetical protein RR48_07010 [Papilio machaon]
MGDSSDSEEFYDAEEFTPIKGSKRSSLCKNINVTDGGSPILKEKIPVVKPEELPQPTTHSTPAVEASVEDDRTSVKNWIFPRLCRVARGFRSCGAVCRPRKRTTECLTLRCPPTIPIHWNIPSTNFRDLVAPSASSREPSTISDDPLASDNRSQNGE